MWPFGKQRPKWQHRRPSVRRAAVEVLEDTTILWELVESDRDEDVRNAARARLIELRLPSAIESRDLAEVVRLQAVDHLTDQSILGEIATSNSFGRAAESAAQRVHDQTIVRGIARNAKLATCRMIAVGRIWDQSLLASIVRKDENEEVRRSALARVKDQILLTDIALKNPDSKLGQDAVKKIKEPSKVAKLATSHPHKRIRLKAVADLHDQGYLMTVARTAKDKDVRLLAIKRIEDRSEVKKILKMEDDFGVLTAAEQHRKEVESEKQRERNQLDRRRKAVFREALNEHKKRRQKAFIEALFAIEEAAYDPNQTVCGVCKGDLSAGTVQVHVKCRCGWSCTVDTETVDRESGLVLGHEEKQIDRQYEEHVGQFHPAHENREPRYCGDLIYIPSPVWCKNCKKNFVECWEKFIFVGSRNEIQKFKSRILLIETQWQQAFAEGKVEQWLHPSLQRDEIRNRIEFLRNKQDQKLRKAALTGNQYPFASDVTGNQIVRLFGIESFGGILIVPSRASKIGETGERATSYVRTLIETVNPEMLDILIQSGRDVPTHIVVSSKISYKAMREEKSTDDFSNRIFDELPLPDNVGIVVQYVLIDGDRLDYRLFRPEKPEEGESCFSVSIPEDSKPILASGDSEITMVTLFGPLKGNLCIATMFPLGFKN